MAEDWVDQLGGWDNLLQGLGGAVMSTIVAALTAWLILAGTRRHERRLADELDARAAARELIDALTEAGLDFSAAAKAKDKVALGPLTLKLARVALSRLPAFEVVDPVFVANRLRPFLATITEGLAVLSRSPDPWAVTHHGSNVDLIRNVGLANQLISGWLTARADRRRRRAFAQVAVQRQTAKQVRPTYHLP